MKIKIERKRRKRNWTGKIEVKDLILLVEVLTQIHDSVVSEIVVWYYLRQSCNAASWSSIY